MNKLEELSLEALEIQEKRYDDIRSIISLTKDYTRDELRVLMGQIDRICISSEADMVNIRMKQTELLKDKRDV